MESVAIGNCSRHEWMHREDVGMSTGDHRDADRDRRDQRPADESRAGSGALAGERSPKQPDPQQLDSDGADVSPAGTEPEREDAADDDTSVERYRDSPGAAIDTTSGDVPEPNEPG